MMFLSRAVVCFLLFVVVISVLPIQAQDPPLTETYQSGYFYLHFDYPAEWNIVEQTSGVLLLNYDYDNSQPNDPGEARMQFLPSYYFYQRGLMDPTSDPVALLDALRPVFDQGDDTMGEAVDFTLGDYPAARADGTFRGNQTVYLAVSNADGDLVLVGGEASAEDFATFESLFLDVAARVVYAPAKFDDPLPIITPANARQLARYIQFDTSGLPSGQTEHVIFSPDGTLAANVLGFDGVQVWDTVSGDLVNNWEDVRASQVAFSPDNSHFVAVDFNAGLQTVDMSTGMVTDVESQDRLRTVAYSADGSLIATGGNSGAVRLWDVATGDIAETLVQPGGNQVKSVVLSSDGNWLAATGSPGRIILWRLDSEMSPNALIFGDEEAGVAEGLAFSLDGSRLAVLATYGGYTVFDVESGEAILSGHTGDDRVSFPAIALNNDGSLLAVAVGDDGEIGLIDVATDMILTTQNQGGDEVSSLAFSSDGTQLLAGGFYRETLVIWAASRP